MWVVEVEDEVESWLDSLQLREFASRERIVLMTVFRKQRRREQPEIRRARTAMQRSIASEEEESL